MKNKKIILIFISIILFIVGISLILYSNKLKVKEYIITFDTLGGTLVEKQIVKENEKAKIPIDPTKTGYIFDNWYLDNQLFDFDTIITKDLTLVAKWIEDETIENVKISFDTTGGSEIKVIEIKKGEKLTQPNPPEKEGYIFEAWYLNDQIFDFDTEILSDINLVAKWNKVEDDTKKYTITFNTNGGSNVASQIIIENNTAKKPANPTKPGYTFKEWQLNGKVYDFNTKVSNNLTLNAIWEKIQTYTITFNTNGGSNVASQTIEKNNLVKKPTNPTKSGYTFKEWQLNGKGYDFNTKVVENLTLTATWIQKKYVVEVSRIDNFSPDRKLAVKEEGKNISVNAIKFNNGILLANGKNLIVSYSEISSEKTLKVILKDGTEVSAGITYVD